MKKILIRVKCKLKEIFAEVKARKRLRKVLSQPKNEVKKGKKLEIVGATANDNVDGETSVYVYLVNPSGIISKVTAGEKVKLTEKGVYELRYLAVDKFGNLNIVYYDITVV